MLRTPVSVPVHLALVPALCALPLLAGCDSGSGPSAPELASFPEIPPLERVALDSVQRRHYENDAYRLALRFLGDREAMARHPVEIPAALQASLRAALFRVADSEGEARDTVVEILPVHTFPDPPLHEVVVSAAFGADWIDVWREGRLETGNEGIDALVERWDLTLDGFSDLGRTPRGVLRSPRPLNQPALAARFEEVDGVRFADPNGFGVGDGNDIEAEALGTGWRLSFSVGTGDCPAGCIFRRFWNFLVSEDGSVVFEGVTGDSFPLDHHLPSVSAR